MRRNPRDAHEPMLSPYLIWRIVFVSVILMSGTFGLFLWEMESGVSIEHARTVAVNTLVMFEAFYLLNTRYMRRSVLNTQGLFGSGKVLFAIALVMAFQMLYTYLPWMQTLFGTTALDAATWGIMLLVSSTVLFIVEAEKYLLRGRGRKRG